MYKAMIFQKHNEKNFLTVFFWELKKTNISQNATCSKVTLLE